MQAPLSTSRDATFRITSLNATRRSASLRNRQIRAAVQEATQLNNLSDWLQQERGCSVEYLEASTSGSQQSWTVQRDTQQGQVPLLLHCCMFCAFGVALHAVHATYWHARSMLSVQVLFSLPGDHAVTMTDVQTEPAVAGVAEGRGELIGLALWLMYERSKVSSGTSICGSYQGLAKPVVVFTSNKDRLGAQEGSNRQLRQCSAHGSGADTVRRGCLKWWHHWVERC